MNRITKETWDLWYENIAWMCFHFKQDSEQAAEEIMKYLAGEGAFELIEDE